MRLNYRVPVEGDGFAAWLRELRTASGVYVIKEKPHFLDRGEVLYVGESDRGCLYKTLCRHFQAWGGHTAGATYDRRRVVVAVLRFRKPERVKATQWRLIEKLRPRDNVQRSLFAAPEVK